MKLGEITVFYAVIEQSKEIKQNWARLENFNISFCVIINHFCQDYISPKENDSGLSLNTMMKFSLLFLIDLKSWVV